ncbi:MAG TPA: Holliday junction branch migration DNA helicase RuvB [Hydrogenothermaceae bacterium]|nr:Holliday junction branch migration DNA helicase RuvB [Hydrogenothermaceae bacterium]
MSENVLNLRPKSLLDFIGQEKVKQQIKLFIQASKQKKRPLDHILFTGPPGLGKTTLANLIAKELDTNIITTTGAILNKKGDLAGILTSLEDGDVLFIDEIHRINKSVEELLYSAMEDFKIDILIGKDRSAKTIRLDIPKFTLIGATTRTGLLSSPLLSRFGIILQFDFYDENSLSKIIKKSAEKLKIKITNEASLEIAKRSRGTPRIANRLIKRIEDFAVVKNKEKIDLKLVLEAFEFLGIDEYGLDFKDREYLKILAFNFEGKPTGIKNLCIALSEKQDTIEQVIEPYLIKIGFIIKTPKGRVITEKGFNHIKNYI